MPGGELFETIMSEKQRYAYVAWTNTDLTEGRGTEFPLAVCDKEATAIRLGKGGYVMGCDCDITKVEIIEHNGWTYGPVRLVHSTREDDAEQVRLDAKAAAKEKAKAAGLTDAEINALSEV